MDLPISEAEGDAELVQRALGGDCDGFRMLVERHWPLMVALALCKVHDPSLADDIAQEAFIKAHAQLHSLRQPAQFGAWLTRIVRNLTLDHLRRRGKERVVYMEDLSTIPQHTLTVQNEPEMSDGRRRAVWQAVGALPEKLRAVVLLRFVSALPTSEIAARLDQPASTVRVRLHRALKLLRIKIEPVEREEDAS